MNEVFELIGWEGSAYMQAQRETAHTLPVLHTTGWAEENGVLTPTPLSRGPGPDGGIPESVHL